MKTLKKKSWQTEKHRCLIIVVSQSLDCSCYSSVVKNKSAPKQNEVYVCLCACVYVYMCVCWCGGFHVLYDNIYNDYDVSQMYFNIKNVSLKSFPCI